MKIQYFSDTDTLYINLLEVKIANTDMLTENLIVDFDDTEKVVSITIEQASQTIDLSNIETIDLPETVASTS